ncbi:MAG: hypothetical protein AUH76_03345 [Candidatus Rokubacteria bacterium 13_1_40CM_4_67_11]|nr:MAG: hypothetical protein AUH45_06080 [Gemmatimonadetes bacterium 13_1_40CM_69_22]OLC65048.1 MAG: hypothetical protein AUH76_03345 [Candidatus Rokubacteria bacterium 13_1_40CM_4_67_11]
MHLLALLGLLQAGTPVLEFPEPGLDDPAAYEGYQTRVYQDARGNAFQVYLNRSTGRVVHLWADAADESVGFTARDSGGTPAELAWSSSGAVVAASGRTRSVSYSLEDPSPITLGLFLLGSMRVERDFQYARRDSLPLDAPSFPQAELTKLIDHLARLGARERARHLSLLGVQTIAALRARLSPQVTLQRSDTSWVVRVEQVSFDGKSHLWLALEGDARETVPALAGGTVTIRRPAGGPVRIAVRVTTDAPALTPLSRADIFNDDFRRFYETVRADSARPERFRRLEREVRGMELLCYGEKLMAGLPNFATYFGRDMLMTALLMEPVWAPAMPEHVIASALRKLSPTGTVSHEEALGGQAIREHAAEYNRLVDAGRLAEARAVLRDLQAVRENYVMVDDDFQLPVVAARYLGDPRVSAARKRGFLLEERRLARLVSNLAYVARRADAYAHNPIATNLVDFPRDPEGRWISASWRDSRAGYGGGRFAMDVNVIWVPHALEAIGTILDALQQLRITPTIRAEPLASFARDRAALQQAIAAWRGAERHFRVAVGDVGRPVGDRLRWLPLAERQYWDGVIQRSGLPADTLRFLALSLDENGRPIPIVNTDPAMLLLLEPLGRDRTLELVGPIMLPYPWGLFVDDLGPLVANDAYTTREVWERFRQDPYHSPTVVWGRDVNALLAGLAQQIASAPSPSGADVAPLANALQRTVTAVDRSGLRHAELWSYRIENGRLVPVRYGTSSDVQLWSLTDLAVQFALDRIGRP